MTLGTKKKKKIEQISIAIKIISIVFPIKYLSSLYSLYFSFEDFQIRVSKKKKKKKKRNCGKKVVLKKTAIEFVLLLPAISGIELTHEPKS